MAVGFIIVAATLESVFALCIGGKIFAVLMRTGVIPESVCERCNDLWADAPARRRPAISVARCSRPDFGGCSARRR